MILGHLIADHPSLRGPNRRGHRAGSVDFGAVLSALRKARISSRYPRSSCSRKRPVIAIIVSRRRRKSILLRNRISLRRWYARSQQSRDCRSCHQCRDPAQGLTGSDSVTAGCEQHPGRWLGPRVGAPVRENKPRAPLSTSTATAARSRSRDDVAMFHFR